MEWGRVRITPGFLLLMAWLYYSDQGRLAVLAIAASAMHELAHCVCLWLFGVRVERLCISAVGAELTVSGRLSYLGEIVTAAAGPVSNILIARLAVLTMGEQGYLFAGINLALAVFNLLPVAGLDGGRCLACVGEWLLGPQGADILCRVVNGAVVFCAAIGGIAVFLQGGNVTGLIVGLWLCANLVGALWRTDGKKGLSFCSGTGKMVHV